MNNNISLLQNQLKHTLGQLELSALPGKGELDKLKKNLLICYRELCSVKQDSQTNSIFEKDGEFEKYCNVLSDECFALKSAGLDLSGSLYNRQNALGLRTLTEYYSSCNNSSYYLFSLPGYENTVFGCELLAEKQIIYSAAFSAGFPTQKGITELLQIASESNVHLVRLVLLDQKKKNEVESALSVDNAHFEITVLKEVL